MVALCDTCGYREGETWRDAMARSWKTVAKASQRPVDGRTWRDGIPLWAMVCIVSGLVLMAIGFLSQDPVARWVWSVLH